jgi:hypothetical protein
MTTALIVIATLVLLMVGGAVIAWAFDIRLPKQ